MAAWHQTIIIGHAGHDASMRETQYGNVTNFSVAVTEKWNDSNTGERREKTTWYKVSCWGKLAEIAKQYVFKGNQVMVIGAVDVRAYTGRDDSQPKAELLLTARELKLLSNRSNEDYHDENIEEYYSEDDIPF